MSNLYCFKDVLLDGEILFNSGKKYSIDDIIDTATVSSEMADFFSELDIDEYFSDRKLKLQKIKNRKKQTF